MHIDTYILLFKQRTTNTPKVSDKS